MVAVSLYTEYESDFLSVSSETLPGCIIILSNDTDLNRKAFTPEINLIKTNTCV